YNGGTYNFNVDWGDSSNSDITAWDDGDNPHTYADAGASTYTITITGTITGFRFNNAGDKTLIQEVQSWGPVIPGQFNFYGTPNLTVTATDALDLTNTTTLRRWLRDCSSLTTIPGLNSWDVSLVTDFSDGFQDASSFNQDISGWDVGSVTTFAYTFRNASSFAPDISGWDTGSATTFFNMFYGATSFDQDLGSWDIADVTAMNAMFVGVTLSTANYSAILIGWEGQVEKPNVTFSGGNSLYSAGAAATARAALVTNGWTITDGGEEP
ncbi:hypothetical protein LCGC14_2756740, partial [marine sediment metagenome]